MPKNNYIQHCAALVTLALILLLLTNPIPVLAKSLYVNAAEGPRGIVTALSKAEPGMTVYLKAGLYCGPVRLDKVMGTPERPIVLRGETGAILDGRTVQQRASGEYGGSALLLGNCQNLVIENLEIMGGERGITIGGSQNIAVRNCYIHDVRNYGIMSYYSNGTSIERNKLMRSSCEHGIYISGPARNIIVRENLIQDTHINGLHLNGRILAPLVERNIFWRTGSYPTCEGGAAITVIGGTRDALIRNNLFLHIYGQGITVNGPGVRIEHNVFHEVAWSAVLCLSEGLNLKFVGNIIQERKSVPLQIQIETLSSLVCDHNLYVLGRQAIGASRGQKFNWSDWKVKGFDRASVVDVSPFLDPAKNKKDEHWTYHLRPGSKAVDLGPTNSMDASQPPGLGSKRADMGMYGGQGNGWSED